MPNGPHPASHRCALPGCDETIEPSEAGGPRRLYCTHDHRGWRAGSEASPASRQSLPEDAEPVRAITAAVD